MPQLKFAWWLLKFFLAWTLLLLMFMVMLKTKLNKKATNISMTTTPSKKPKWTWN